MLYFPDKQTVYDVLSRKVDQVYCVQHKSAADALEGQVSLLDALGFFVSMVSPSSPVSVMLLRKDDLIDNYVDKTQGEDRSKIVQAAYRSVPIRKNFGVLSRAMVEYEMIAIVSGILETAFGFKPDSSIMSYDSFVSQDTAGIGVITATNATKELYLMLQEQEGHPGSRGRIVYLENTNF